VFHAPSAAALPQAHPARAKVAAATAPQAFVCVGEACSMPVLTPAELIAGVNAATGAVRHS
jgi:hypothetical protein